MFDRQLPPTLRQRIANLPTRRQIELFINAGAVNDLCLPHDLHVRAQAHYLRTGQEIRAAMLEALDRFLPAFEDENV